MARLISSGWTSGDIRIWTKPLAKIPQGWQLCNGLNGTPDMRDRAVVGAGHNYSQNQSFGGDSVRPSKPSVYISVGNHTLSTSRMPSHHHSIATNSDSHTSSGGISASRATGVNYTQSSGNSGSSIPHKHSGSALVGNVGLVDTRQKSIAVYWIMKL